MHASPRTTTALALALGATLLVVSPVSAGTPTTQQRHRGESSRVIIDWERTSIRTVYTEGLSPVPSGALYLGFTSLAMYGAVQRAQHVGHSSATAAAAVAAHDVLAEYFPASQATLDADLATSLAAVPDGPAEATGTRIGAAVADALIASRADDGRNDPSIVYAKPAGVGVWQPAAGGSMLVPWLGFVRPLVLRHVIGAPGPDSLTSADYAADFDETRRLGAATGSERTAWQTDTALFFNSNSAILLSEAVLRLLDEEPMSLRRTARMFAAMHAAMADSIIAVWRQKYDVGFWRPIQAIAGAADDGNPATEPQEGWASLLPTPPYSDYVSGHAGLTGPAAEVIRRFLGDHTTLTLHSYNTSSDRTCASISAIEADALDSRIWGGLHFRTAMDDGYAIAHRTARCVLARLG
ncbi:MAG: vanadium-dependent haloperoxidase [Nocardioidaceae bacterium]